MLEFITFLLDWSEVWAILIPAAILIRRKQPEKLAPVVFYVWMALFINVAIDVTWKLRTVLPASYNSNNYLYNLHSVVRFFLFAIFFIRLEQPFLAYIKKALMVIYALFLIVNFGFFERFFNYWQFSNRLLSVEAVLLLFYVLQYYLFKIGEGMEVFSYNSDFWIVTGLGVYVSINFFIFLLYHELTVRMQHFAINLWNVHNITFIIFNLFLAKGFNESRE
ncbi:hypothetical protein KXQ82_00010 [Mucilaginibacter sp. HMF5004]|uniref:hypothetical protein n=1 Tax=Mucilaginibacter rivuli TaxID=2857527 RepID=UPI001C604D01|nr:hypothetical protein [Mucilaginibacter rivuli]MBW4888069.1 hypothetical protein [Mucilaginibacter rivuli]